jgi:hypothetical protein
MREWQRIEHAVHLAVARPLAGMIFILFLGVRGLVHVGRRFRDGCLSRDKAGQECLLS